VARFFSLRRCPRSGDRTVEEGSKYPRNRAESVLPRTLLAVGAETLQPASPLSVGWRLDRVLPALGLDRHALDELPALSSDEQKDKDNEHGLLIEELGTGSAGSNAETELMRCSVGRDTSPVTGPPQMEPAWGVRSCMGFPYQAMLNTPCGYPGRCHRLCHGRGTPGASAARKDGRDR
jgi:hypothetical protein